jgi:hypothetical protein
MDAQTLSQMLSGRDVPCGRLGIDLSQWCFVYERGGICYFQHVNGKPGLYGVAAELVSHVRFADASGGGDIQAIRKAVAQVEELSIHPCVRRR